MRIVVVVADGIVGIVAAVGIVVGISAVAVAVALVVVEVVVAERSPLRIVLGHHTETEAEAEDNIHS